MRQRRVTFSNSAEASLLKIIRYIAKSSSIKIAENYARAIRKECHSLERFAERGTIRSDIRRGLRIIGYDRSASIAFAFDGDEVLIVNIFYRGINVARKLQQ